MARSINLKKYLIIVLLLIEIISVFLMCKSYAYKDVDKVEENSNISKEMFAMYKEVKEGEYEEVTDTETFPLPGYSFNIEKSNCIDRKGNLVEGILSSDNTSVTVTSNKTVFCYVYFDIIPKGYAIYSATDNSLTFYNDKNTNLLSVGDTYNNKIVTAIYRNFENTSYTSASEVPWSEYASSIVSISVVGEIKPISTAYWFRNLTKCKTANLSLLDTSNVTDMSYMFRDASLLEEIILSDKWDTSNVTNMYSLFGGCTKLKSVNTSNWNTEKVTRMDRLFYNCASLTAIDLNSFNTSQVTKMGEMFYGCSSLINIIFGKSWDTSNVTSMYAMFEKCSQLTELNLNNWNVIKVTNMSQMFRGCYNLNNLSVSNWNTEKVTNMNHMFQNCNNLKTLELTMWNTKNVTAMSYMFQACDNLELLLLGENWNTGNVTDMAGMFFRTNKLTLDCSKWDVSKVIVYIDFTNNTNIVQPSWVN